MFRQKKGYRTMDTHRRQKCANSFSHFANTYIQIKTPTGSSDSAAFKLYSYQERLVQAWESQQYTIAVKFRQGGFTTTAVIYALWRCLFHENQRVLVCAKTDTEAEHAGKIIDRLIPNLPDWLQPQLKIDNKHEKQFSDTKSFIRFQTPFACRGVSLTHLIIDEAAFIPDMHDHWSALYPTVQDGGKAIILSTTNGLGNWFEEVYHDAVAGRNSFSVIETYYREHPKYQDEGRVSNIKQIMGPVKFAQEIEGEFLRELDHNYDFPTLIDRLMDIVANPKLSKPDRYAVIEAITRLKGAYMTPKEFRNDKEVLRRFYELDPEADADIFNKDPDSPLRITLDHLDENQQFKVEGFLKDCGLSKDQYTIVERVHPIPHKASVYLGEEGLEKSWQGAYSPTIPCVHCGGESRIAMVVMEDIKTDRGVDELHRNGGSGDYWVHDACSVATYFCKECLKPTSEMNQA